jgi:hypothetical protein
VIEGPFVGIGGNDNAPALAAITTIGAPPGDEFFPPKADTPTATSSGSYCNLGRVNKFHWA